MRNDNEVCVKVLISKLPSDNISYLLQLIAYVFINTYLRYRSNFFCRDLCIGLITRPEESYRL